MKAECNIFWQNFVHNVMWLRNHYDFSEEKMAEIMGIDVEAYRDIEKGICDEDLSVEVFCKIYNFFHVRCDEFFSKRF